MDREFLVNTLSNAAFYLGMLLVLVSSFVSHTLIQVSLIILGIVVGLMNIEIDEVVRFLLSLLAVIATTSILKVALLNVQLPVSIITPIVGFLDSLILFMSPAALVVGVGTLIDVIRD